METPTMMSRIIKWILQHLHHTLISDLTDELMIDILSRLPVDSVQSCRAVCSSWRVLSTTSHFADLHLRRSRANPIILVLRLMPPPVPRPVNQPPAIMLVRRLIHPPPVPPREGITMMCINDFSKIPWFIRNVSLSVKTLEFTSILSVNVRHVRASCDGLLLVSNGSCTEYRIGNPVTQEVIAFSLDTDLTICGFFFHPSKNEYSLLIRSKDLTNYYVYGLSTKHRRIIGRPPVPFLRDDNSVATCEGLFWTLTSRKEFNGITVNTEQILKYDSETELFSIMPHPAERSKRDIRTTAQLLVMEGKLGCCAVYAKSVDVWILEDFKCWRWVKKYVVNLDKEYSKENTTSVIGFQNGNLVVYRIGVGLLCCNLRLNAVRKSDALSPVLGMQYCPSFLSLQNANILPDTTASSSSSSSIQSV